MSLKRLDHVNVRTTNLAAMIEWYGRVLGLAPGERPPFPFGGAWLYCEGFPIVHLVETTKQYQAIEPTLEHFAISAVGLEEFTAHLREHKVRYQGSVAPGFGIKQINIWDPDGNHIHIDFTKDEEGEVGDYDGN